MGQRLRINNQHLPGYTYEVTCIVPWRSASSGAQQGKLRLEQEFPALEFRTHKSGQLRYIEMRYPEAQ